MFLGEEKVPGKSNFPGSPISMEVKFPGKSNFREVEFSSQISREVKFPGKSNFSGSQISGKLNFREAAKWLV